MLRLICSFELVHVDGLLPHTHIILDGDGLVSKPALDELQDLGGDVEDLLSFVLLVLNRDVRRVVSKTSHFERSYSACRIATAEALRILNRLSSDRFTCAGDFAGLGKIPHGNFP